MLIHKSSVGQFHMGPSLSSPVDPSVRAITYKVSQRNSTKEIHSWWDRIMRWSEREASYRHENEWASKTACKRTRHHTHVNLRKKFILCAIARERIMRWCKCPTKKQAANRALLILSREHHTFSFALTGNSLSDNSSSRTVASTYAKDRWTERLWTLASDMRAREKVLLVLCSFSRTHASAIAYQQHGTK